MVETAPTAWPPPPSACAKVSTKLRTRGRVTRARDIEGHLHRILELTFVPPYGVVLDAVVEHFTVVKLPVNRLALDILLSGTQLGLLVLHILVFANVKPGLEM